MIVHAPSPRPWALPAAVYLYNFRAYANAYQGRGVTRDCRVTPHEFAIRALACFHAARGIWC